MAVSVTHIGTVVAVELLSTHQPFSWAPLVGKWWWLLTSAHSLAAWDKLLPMVNREVSDQTCPLLLEDAQWENNSDDHEQHSFCKVLGLGERFWK